jgi:hypothetical protein
VRAWMVLGELQDGVIDGACGQGAKRDGRVSAFHRIECTPPHSLFSNALSPTGKCADTLFTPAPVAHPLPTPEKSRRTACRTAPTTRTTEGTPTMELTSQQVHPTNPIQARKRIVHIYQQTQNYCETAQRCHTSPQRVRKWVQRDQQHGEQALHNLPKTQKRQPRKTDPDLEQRVRQRHQKKMSTRHGMAFLSLAGSWLRLCGVPTERTIQPDWAGVRRGVGLALPRVLVWRQSFCVRWGRTWGAFRTTSSAR